MPIKCLLINGSERADSGNSAQLLKAFRAYADDFEYRTLNLVEVKKLSDAQPLLEWADALVFATGTYWDSWGWPLQRFLELATITEGTDVWLGKPVAVLVSMHSVGGKSVLSRLQGVLSTLGAAIPPMSGVVISAVGQDALQVSDQSIADDTWQISDLEIVSANVKCVCEGRRDFRSWKVDRTGFDQLWIET